METIKTYTLHQLAAKEKCCYLTIYNRRHEYVPVVFERGYKNIKQYVRYLCREDSMAIKKIAEFSSPEKIAQFRISADDIKAFSDILESTSDIVSNQSEDGDKA